MAEAKSTAPPAPPNTREARVVKAKTAACEGCSKRFRRRDLVEVTEENSAFTLSVFVGERYCRSCAGDRGIL